MELEALMQALLRPGALSDGEAVEDVRQTHLSVVFLTREHAWKLKKPVDFGFVDYTTPRKRALMCMREVALNRRLAPGVYLGVEKVRLRRDGSTGVGGRGRVVDSLVKMRRLDDADSLAARVADGRAGVDDVRAVARRLAAFHRSCRPAPSRFRAVAAFLGNQAENFAQAPDLAGALLPEGAFAELLGHAQRQAPLVRSHLAAREAAGWVRDGHGDLRMEHVYLEDGAIEVIDCIEFNERFRYGDVALDIAFLAMDLESAGYPDLATALLAEHASQLGGPVPVELMASYLSYRSVVRAKVALLASVEPEIGAEGQDAQRLLALHHFLHAVRFARGTRQPRLILSMGLSGAGKSTVAGLAGRLLGARVVSADETRKRLAGLGPFEHPAGGLDSGLYTPEMNRRVYGALMDEAAAWLAAGRSIVLDATFQRAADREAARALATQHGAAFTGLLCEAPEAVVRERLGRRAQGPGDAWSDAGWDVYLAQRERFEWPAGAEAGEVARISTDASRMAIARRLFGVLVDGA